MDIFLGEVRIFSFTRILPQGWMPCDGRLLPISEYTDLFKLLGTAFGGDGQTNFALPDLRGRAPVHTGGPAGGVGTQSGEEVHTLSIQEMPRHTHPVTASTSAPDQTRPSILAGTTNAYTGPTAPTTLLPAAVSNTGGGQGHANMQPSLALGFCMAVVGTVPPRN